VYLIFLAGFDKAHTFVILKTRALSKTGRLNMINIAC